MPLAVTGNFSGGNILDNSMKKVILSQFNIYHTERLPLESGNQNFSGTKIGLLEVKRFSSMIRKIDRLSIWNCKNNVRNSILIQWYGKSIRFTVSIFKFSNFVLLIYRPPPKIIEYPCFTEHSCLRNPTENLKISRFWLVMLKRAEKQEQFSSLSWKFSRLQRSAELNKN